MKTTSAGIEVDPSKVFNVKMTAEQVVLILGVLREAHFKGSQTHLAASAIDAIQDPILREAHAGKVDE